MFYAIAWYKCPSLVKRDAVRSTRVYVDDLALGTRARLIPYYEDLIKFRYLLVVAETMERGWPCKSLAYVALLSTIASYSVIVSCPHTTTKFLLSRVQGSEVQERELTRSHLPVRTS